MMEIGLVLSTLPGIGLLAFLFTGIAWIIGQSGKPHHDNGPSQQSKAIRRVGEGIPAHTVGQYDDGLGMPYCQDPRAQAKANMNPMYVPRDAPPDLHGGNIDWNYYGQQYHPEQPPVYNDDPAPEWNIRVEKSPTPQLPEGRRELPAPSEDVDGVVDRTGYVQIRNKWH
jgi:hypothetical protein